MKIDEIQKDEIIVAAKSIRRECSNFINSSLKPIYRGAYMRHQVQELVIRTDRKPLSAGLFGSNCFNLFIESQFKIERIRSISLFCSTSYEVAKDFALGNEIAYIFPKNDSKILVLGGVSDSAELVDEMFYKFDDMVYDAKMRDDEDIIFKLETLKEARSKLTKEQYSKLEGILKGLSGTTKRVKLEVISPNELHRLERTSELMIFGSSTAWGINSEGVDYQKLLSILNGKK